MLRVGCRVGGWFVFGNGDKWGGTYVVQARRVETADCSGAYEEDVDGAINTQEILISHSIDTELD